MEASWRRVASTHNLEDLLKQRTLSDRGGPGLSRRKKIALGWALLLGGLACVAAAVGTVVLKLLPPVSNPVLRALQQDWYFCLLIPQLLPVTLVAVALSWFSLKLFKHNS